MLDKPLSKKTWRQPKPLASSAAINVGSGSTARTTIWWTVPAAVGTVPTAPKASPGTGATNAASSTANPAQAAQTAVSPAPSAAWTI